MERLYDYAGYRPLKMDVVLPKALSHRTCVCSHTGLCKYSCRTQKQERDHMGLFVSYHALACLGLWRLA